MSLSLPAPKRTFNLIFYFITKPDALVHTKFVYILNEGIICWIDMSNSFQMFCNHFIDTVLSKKAVNNSNNTFFRTSAVPEIIELLPTMRLSSRIVCLFDCSEDYIFFFSENNEKRSTSS